MQRFLGRLLEGGRALDLNVAQVEKPRPFDGVLVSYGNGRPDLTAMIERHLAGGGRVVHLDMRYWGRAFRMAIDGLHPSALPPAPADRFEGQGFTLRDEYDPQGPIILVGIGPKSRHVDASWEERALKRIEKHWPGKRVIFRPKPRRPYVRLPVTTDAQTPIAQLLKGASLVVTRHSNVGVDACFQGIPVLAETGAPALLYGNDWTAPRRPSEDERRDFLRRLAWWNWREDEAVKPAIWQWIVHALSVIPKVPT